MSAIAVNRLVSGSLSSRLIDLTSKACSVTKEAVAVAVDAIATGSPMVLDQLREQERELDRLDVEINDGVAEAITHADERKFHELLVCLKFALGLERIGALLLNVGDSVASAGCLDPQDSKDTILMASVLEKLLANVGTALGSRTLPNGKRASKCIAEMERIDTTVQSRHTGDSEGVPTDAAQAVFISRSLRLAANHAQYLAEQVCHFVSGSGSGEDAIPQSDPVQQEVSVREEPVKQVFLDWLQCRERNIRRSALGTFPTRAMHIRLRPFQPSKRMACR